MKLIVGIDPGATAGIAAIDALARTRFAETFSSRNFPSSDIINWILERGEPIIVATDKAKCPLVVRKIAAAFGARLYTPAQDMTLAEKSGLTTGFPKRSDHENDALAAALFAKNQFFGLLEKIEQSVDARQQGAVKKLLVTSRAANIETAIEMLETRKAAKRGKRPRKTRTADETRVLQELENARKRNAALEKEITRLGNEPGKKVFIRNESAAMRQLRESSAKLLMEKNGIIKGLEKIISGEYLVAVPFERGSEMNGKAVIIDVTDNGAIEEAERAGAAAIITDLDVVSSLPVISKRKVNIMQIDKFLVIEKTAIEEKKDDFVAWLDAYKENRKEKNQ